MRMPNALRIELEKRIARDLIRELKRAGFVVSCVFDGEEHYYPSTETETIGRLFNLDEASLRVVRAGQLAAYDKERKVPRRPHAAPPESGGAGGDWSDAEHGVLLVMGNGYDIISDWNFTDGDPDGFNKAMHVVAEKVNRMEQDAA